MRVLAFTMITLVYALSVNAQWDFVMSTEGIGSLHKIKYYRIQQTDAYLKSDQFFGTFDAATIEPRYQIQFNNKSSICVGLPFGFSSYS